MWEDLLKDLDISRINVKNSNLENEVEKVNVVKIPFFSTAIINMLSKIKVFSTSTSI